MASFLMTLAVITISSSTFRWNLSPPSSPTSTVTLHQMKLSSPPDGTFSWWTFIRWIFLHSFSSDGRLFNDFTYDDFLLLYSLVASFLMTLVTISSSTSLSYSSSDETFTPGGTSSIWAFIRWIFLCHHLHHQLLFILMTSPVVTFSSSTLLSS